MEDERFDDRKNLEELRQEADKLQMDMENAEKRGDSEGYERLEARLSSIREEMEMLVKNIHDSKKPGQQRRKKERLAYIAACIEFAGAIFIGVVTMVNRISDPIGLLAGGLIIVIFSVMILLQLESMLAIFRIEEKVIESDKQNRRSDPGNGTH